MKRLSVAKFLTLTTKNKRHPLALTIPLGSLQYKLDLTSAIPGTLVIFQLVPNLTINGGFSVDKRSHSRECSTRNLWQSFHLFAVGPCSALPQLYRVQDFSSREIHRLPLGRIFDSRRMCQEEGAECSEREHHDGETGFCQLPK